MQPGDILLMNTYESQRRLMPGCKYDHIAVYLGDAFLIEADGTGVMMNHVYSYAFKDDDHGCIMRLKKSCSKKRIDELLYWLRQQMAMEFGSFQARKVPVLKNTDEQGEKNRTFCSRLVAQAYHQIGIDLVKNPDFCSPDDILGSDFLVKVEPSLQPFTADMSNTVMNNQKQRADSDTYLADLFQTMGQFYNEDIQKIDQLLIAAMNNIDKDADALDFILQQRWMTPAEKQTEMMWPWFNDDNALFAHFVTTENVLFFLRNQILHYDLTYLPISRQNAINMWVIAKIKRESKVVKAISKQFKSVLDEAIRIRKRLEKLYILTFDRDHDGFFDFSEKYGFESNFEFKEGAVDISKILLELMEYGPSNISELLNVADDDDE
ncbi:YiiX/YebB-like N1pC/P60 family cysteine hydrolase [Xylanibacter oryzae]|uniref:YiiX/YebB-like N1pC/P60 family cysteine hydrolase n=1 Tax=Xylanibacter oryzae TaxID=185293 RepID=UPI00056BF8C1|nr:YiiX/YebB-like N1pC/P60 family cysteine hydrolase [Xylanibacter oryzae]